MRDDLVPADDVWASLRRLRDLLDPGLAELEVTLKGGAQDGKRVIMPASKTPQELQRLVITSRSKPSFFSKTPIVRKFYYRYDRLDDKTRTWIYVYERELSPAEIADLAREDVRRDADGLG